MTLTNLDRLIHWSLPTRSATLTPTSMTTHNDLQTILKRNSTLQLSCMLSIPKEHQSKPSASVTLTSHSWTVAQHGLAGNSTISPFSHLKQSQMVEHGTVHEQLFMQTVTWRKHTLTMTCTPTRSHYSKVRPPVTQDGSSPQVCSCQWVTSSAMDMRTSSVTQTRLSRCEIRSTHSSTKKHQFQNLETHTTATKVR